MMKSSADNAKVTKKIRDYKMKNWLFFFQILAIIITIGAFIYAYLIAHKYYFLSDFSVSLLLFIFGYNNYKIYKRKNFTTIYIIFGIFFIISGIWGIFNG